MKNQFSCIAISILAIAILFLCSRKRKEGMESQMLKLELVPDNPGERIKVGTVYIGQPGGAEEAQDAARADVENEEVKKVMNNIAQINSQAENALNTVTQTNMAAMMKAAQNRAVDEAPQPIQATNLVGTGLQTVQPAGPQTPAIFDIYKDSKGKPVNSTYFWLPSAWCKSNGVKVGTVMKRGNWTGTVRAVNANDTNRSNPTMAADAKVCFVEFSVPVNGMLKYGDSLTVVGGTEEKDMVANAMQTPEQMMDSINGPEVFDSYADSSGKPINGKNLWLKSSYCNENGVAAGSVFKRGNWTGTAKAVNARDVNRGNPRAGDELCFVEFNKRIDGKVQFGQKIENVSNPPKETGIVEIMQSLVSAPAEPQPSQVEVLAADAASAAESSSSQGTKMTPPTFGMYGNQVSGTPTNPNHTWVNSEWCEEVKPAAGTRFDRGDWNGKLLNYNPNATNQGNPNSPDKGCFLQFDTRMEGKVKYGDSLFYN